MEAQRVLRRSTSCVVGAGQLNHGTPAWVPAREEADGEATLEVVSLHWTTLGTLQAAVSGLHVRVNDVEGAR
jgi:hypothetical protein